MNNATFKRLEYNKGETYIQQGIKNNYVPRNALYGGKGSYRMGIPSSLILTVETDDGRIVKRNIKDLAKSINGWSKITDNRTEKLRKKLSNSDIMIDDRDYIVNPENILKL